ncbi:putative tail fiber protein [Shigella phage vB_SboS_Gloob]|nr:putative tail fiber protein [Shigella phage vB_SboS_Gloob]
MADFLSQYTGQQIDEILSSVDDKVSKNDVIDDFAVNDPLFPPSARLTYELKRSVDNIYDTLDNKVIRTDGGEQTINGRKTFAAEIRANAGVSIPTGKKLTIADEPVDSTDGVNLSMLRKHGVSEDTAGVNSGLKIELLSGGYNKLTFDGTNLTTYSGTGVPTTMLLVSGTDTVKYDTSAFVTSIFNDTRFNAYLKVVEYDADMLDIQSQFNTVNTTLAAKVNTSTYNSKMSSLDTSILDLTNNKVNVSTYNTKMAALDSSISGIQSDIGTINTTLSGKVNTSTYNAKMTSLDADIAARVKIGKTNLSSITISASGNSALPDFDLVNLCQVLISAQWGTGNVVDTYRVTITRDGTIKSELLIQKSTSGTVTFAGSVVSSKLRLTITNANTTTACSVDYNLVASF